MGILTFYKQCLENPHPEAIMCVQNPHPRARILRSISLQLFETAHKISLWVECYRKNLYPRKAEILTSPPLPYHPPLDKILTDAFKWYWPQNSITKCFSEHYLETLILIIAAETSDKSFCHVHHDEEVDILGSIHLTFNIGASCAYKDMFDPDKTNLGYWIKKYITSMFIHNQHWNPFWHAPPILFKTVFAPPLKTTQKSSFTLLLNQKTILTQLLTINWSEPMKEYEDICYSCFTVV